MKSGTMDGGSLNTAYISISEYLELTRLMHLLTASQSGELSLEESSRFLKRRDSCLCYHDPGNMYLLVISNHDSELTHP